MEYTRNHEHGDTWTITEVGMNYSFSRYPNLTEWYGVVFNYCNN